MFDTRNPRTHMYFEETWKKCGHELMCIRSIQMYIVTYKNYFNV